MGKGKRLNRTTDMDDALFEALKTKVPQKDTGPDPDDILAGLFENDDGDGEQSGRSSERARAGQSLTIELDDADRQRAEQIVKIIREQTGEQVDILRAIKIALFICPLDEQEIHLAHGMLGSHSHDNE